MSFLKTFVAKFKRLEKFFKIQVGLCFFSIISLCLPFFSDIDNYNQGLVLNAFQGQLGIIGMNLLIISLLAIIFTVEKKYLEKKFKILKSINLSLANILFTTLSLYLLFIYFAITQSYDFGINPLFKSYELGFCLFLGLQIFGLVRCILRVKD